MRVKLYYVLFALMLLGISIGCSKSDSNDDSQASISVSDMCGYWLGVTRTEGDDVEDWSDMAVYYDTDGTAILYEYNVTEWTPTYCTYTLSGNTIKLTQNKSGYTDYVTVISCSSTSCVVSIDGIIIKYKKVGSLPERY